MTLAERIAEQLFTNGRGEEARRLVLELKDGRDGGGYCREVVVDLIERELAAESRLVVTPAGRQRKTAPAKKLRPGECHGKRPQTALKGRGR